MAPIPKRSTERRRANVVPDLVRVPGARKVRVPPPSKTWDAMARAWYLSLKASGQSRYYEPSDWQQAYMLADQMTRMRELDQPNAAMLNAIVAATRDLMTTEGQRRRLHVELTRPEQAGDPEQDAAAADVDNIIALVASSRA